MIAPVPPPPSGYRGRPLRPWVRVSLVSPVDDVAAVDLIADTGCPCSLVIDRELMDRMRHAAAFDMSSNFVPLAGGWLRIMIPELEFDEMVIGYGSDSVSESARRSDAQLTGLVGLSLLRRLGFGGDSESFWIGLA
jgi:hypothetical protein